jgi:hypothetical protein
MGNRGITLISGALSGLASLLVFMIVHAIWITPIWFVMPLGIVLALGGGMVVSWAYSEIKRRLPPPPWAVLAIAGIVFATLLPAFALAQLHPLFFSLDGTLLVKVPVLIRHFILDLLVTAFAMGALIGWWLGRSKRSALATGLAGVMFALGPGHNTAFVTLVPGVGGLALKMLALMAVIIFVAAVVLVYGQELLLKHNEKTSRMDAFEKLGVLNNDRIKSNSIQ